ncbi:MAG: TolB-like protein [Stenotrophomonas sp.]
MRTRSLLLALSASLLCTPSASALSEFGIEGMGVVSTPANERGGSVAVDGRRIVWASDRAGGKGGWDLWQAQLVDGRWQQPQPLALNSAADDTDPFFSADGRWLYFASNRAGGAGGFDLYRAPVTAEGMIGTAQSLGKGVNSRGDERAPALDSGSVRLLFASNGHGGEGGLDLWQARWDGQAFNTVTTVAGANTAADELGAVWLADGRGIVIARGEDTGATRLWLGQCHAGTYTGLQPLALSFNRADGQTLAPGVDQSKPGELLVSGSAPAPKAGKLDIYRMRAPAPSGDNRCR